MLIRRAVLLVEDEEFVRNFLARELEAGSWHVTAVGSGDDALSRLGATKFDVILCDLDLKRGPTGLDVLARLPAINAGTPFILLTAHGSVGRCRDALLLGAADFLQKPITRRTLLAALEHAMASDDDEVPDASAEDTLLDLPYDEAGAAHVRHAIEVIERRYAEHGLSVGDIADEVGVSPDYLARLFKARVGHSPIEHLNKCRIDRARHLMAHSPNLSIYEVGYECGYASASRFARWFRRFSGSVPSQFRMN